MGEQIAQEVKQLTAKQEAFVEYYCLNPNATRAAQLAGYSGDTRTLTQVGAENLAKPYIRAAIDKIRKVSLPNAESILGLMATRATMDVTPYLEDDLTLNVQKLADDGLGHLIVGVKPGRQGPEITLVSPQMATRNLARYHRLLGADVQVDASTTIVADETALAGLVEQITAANQADSVPEDTTTDGSKDK